MVKIEIDTEQLDEVDDRMKYLGSSLNLLDPDGTFKGMPDEAVLLKIMQAVRDDYRKLSDAILALRGAEIDLVRIDQPSLDAIRQLVREEVHKALQPTDQQSEQEQRQGNEQQ